MPDKNQRPFDLETELTGYMPIPRELLEMDLPSTAVLLYGILLDRCTLSRKNRYADELGRVYAIYPLEHLAAALHVSDTSVKRHLRELEEKGLIRRHRQVRNGPSHIFVNLPSGSLKETKCTPAGPEMPPPTGRKVPGNNNRKQRNKSNYYQHGEDESL